MSVNRELLTRWKWIPLPGNLSYDRWRNATKPSECSQLDIRNYLILNPNLVESHICENLNTEKLEKLIQIKRARPTTAVQRLELKLQKPYLTKCSSLSKNLIREYENRNIYERLEELMKIISRSFDADFYTIYIPCKNETELCVYRNGKTFQYGPIGQGYTVAAHVAAVKEPLFVQDVGMDSRFPKGVGNGDNSVGEVLCFPFILPTHDFVAIIEIGKNELKHSFNRFQVKFIEMVLGWMGACIHENGMRRILKTQQKLNDFLLESTKSIFDDMTSIDMVVQNIMVFTKELVDADRCSLFLVDEERNELFADIFDEGDKDKFGRTTFTKKSKIRFGKDKGIAGYVLENKHTLNVYDAYKDDHFNRDVDKITGYRTKNILCLPIATKSKVQGVVEMINSLKADHFSHFDECALKMFTVYCALALHYCRLYNLMALQKAQYSVAIEMIQYHIVCEEEEIKPLLDTPLLPPEEVPEDLRSFSFCGYNKEQILPQLYVQLVIEMFGKDYFDITKLCRFILTVRKNYRPVSYHNWCHGFHVAHCLWCMIDKSPGTFTDSEKAALVVAGLCHDVDHRGYNNDFFQKMSLPLGNLYSTSVMEQHHYKQTVTILHTKGSDIFGHLGASEYKEMLELIREAIIATDLALYFGNQKFLAKSLEEASFDIKDAAMRKRATALMMTAADLCAVCKPWETQKQSIKNLYNEFFEQGDEERKGGFDPIPMMDRAKESEIPKQQLGFINFICMPLYKTLRDILPGTAPLVDGCTEVKRNWLEVEAKNKEEAEQLEQENQE